MRASVHPGGVDTTVQSILTNARALLVAHRVDVPTASMPTAASVPLGTLVTTVTWPPLSVALPRASCKGRVKTTRISIFALVYRDSRATAARLTSMSAVRNRVATVASAHNYLGRSHVRALLAGMVTRAKPRLIAVHLRRACTTACVRKTRDHTRANAPTGSGERIALLTSMNAQILSTIHAYTWDIATTNSVASCVSVPLDGRARRVTHLLGSALLHKYPAAARMPYATTWATESSSVYVQPTKLPTMAARLVLRAMIAKVRLA